MKKMTMLSVTLSAIITVSALGTSVYAADNSYNSSQKAALKALGLVYARLASSSMVERNYFVSLQTSPQALEVSLSASTACSEGTRFAAVKSTDVFAMISKQAETAIDVGFDNSKTKTQLKAELADAIALANQSQAFGAASLTVCADSTLPPYSEGNVVRFVKIDGKNAFAFEVGYPD